MEQFWSFFLVLFSGIFLSTLFRRFHLPWVVVLIFAGILIGPFGLELVYPDPTIDFISQIGLILLMFMAGLEVKLSNVKEYGEEVVGLSLINGLIPMLAGMVIGYVFGFDLQASLLMGIIFVSSSVAVVVPALESLDLINKKIGRMVTVSTVLQDIASLVFLSIFLQTENEVANLPLWLFYPLLIALLLGLRLFLPKVRKLFSSRSKKEDVLFQRDLRLAFVILFGTVIGFETLGLHPITAGFFSGFILSESIDSEILQQKIHTLSYGLFVPTFFIFVGLTTDVAAFFSSTETLLLTFVVVVGSITAKIASGYFGARLIGYDFREAFMFGATSVPQLSTTLAAAVAAASLSIITDQVVTVMVVLSVVSTIVGSALVSIAGQLFVKQT